MNKATLILIIANAVVMVCAVFALVRNHRVWRYRNQLIDILFSKPDYKWRLAVFRSVDYNDMMWRFWKPLSSFYPDKSFLK